MITVAVNIKTKDLPYKVCLTHELVCHLFYSLAMFLLSKRWSLLHRPKLNILEYVIKDQSNILIDYIDFLFSALYALFLPFWKLFSQQYLQYLFSYNNWRREITDKSPTGKPLLDATWNIISVMMPQTLLCH